MKMRAPEGISSISHEGETFDVTNGAVDVSPRAAEALRAHGFHPWDEPVQDKPSIPHADLVGHLSKLSDDDLKRAISESRERREKAAAREKSEVKPFDPSTVTKASVEVMKRDEMFAFLKFKGVAVSIPITNDALRDIARQHAEP